MSNKTKTINIDPCDIELIGCAGDWKLSILSGDRRYKIKVKLEAWWAPYYVRVMREMLDAEMRRLKRICEDAATSAKEPS